MSEPPANEEDVGSTARHRPSGWRRAGIMAAVLLVVVGATLGVVLTQRPAALNESEATLVGRWYTVFEYDDQDRPGQRTIALEDYGADRTLRVRSLLFARAGDEEAPRWIAPGRTLEDWSAMDWHIEGDSITWTETVRPNPDSLWERLEILVRELRWERSREHVMPMKILALTPTGKTFDAGPVFGRNIVFHSVRVPDDFELPEQPLTPEEAVTWWEQTHPTAEERGSGLPLDSGPGAR